MTVGELKEALAGMPSDALITFCTAGENPYDDYWEAEKVVRIVDISNDDYDRICLLARG